MEKLGPLETVESTLKVVRNGKTILTKKDGLGSEFYPAIYAWIDDQYLGSAHFNASTHSSEWPGAFAAVATLIRAHWHADEMFLGGENFIFFPDDDAEVPPSLPKAFADGDLRVRECIVGDYAKDDGSTFRAIQPYTYGLGHAVNFEDITVLSDEDAVENSVYARALAGVMRAELQPMESDFSEQHHKIGEIIATMGFTVYLGQYATEE